MGNSITGSENCLTAYPWACTLLSWFNYPLFVCQCVWSHPQSRPALADSLRPQAVQCGAKPTNPPAITDLVPGSPMGESSTQQLWMVRKRSIKNRRGGGKGDGGNCSTIS